MFLSLIRSLALTLIAQSYGYNLIPQSNVCKRSVPNALPRRSIVLTSFLGILPTFFCNTSPSHGMAQEEESYSPRPVLQLMITVRPGTEWDERTNSALYITARPNSINNVPSSILQQSNGKPPPVLSARLLLFKNLKDLPMTITLTTDDVTSEGTISDTTHNNQQYWWQAKGNQGDGGLIISARLDTDGVAATRDPSDLVGRAFWMPGTNDSILTLQLQGRGAGGKFFTSRT
jgi:hypothetical protein